MKTFSLPVFRPCLFVLVLAFAGSLTAQSFTRPSSHRRRVYFNNAWKYTRSNPSGAQAASFNDAGWDDVGVPHTFNYLDAFDDMNYLGALFNYWAGTVWYRKHFKVPSALSAGRRFYVEFEGVSQRADVWLNGEKLGAHTGSSVPFVFDITDALNFGDEDNVLAVQVSNTDEATFALPGGEFWTTDRLGGIHRDVWLHVADELHVPLNVYQFQNSWGTYAATRSATAASAEVEVYTQVKNSGASAKQCRLVTQYVGPDNQVALEMEDEETITAGETGSFTQSGTVSGPALWSPDSPSLYTVYSIVYDGDSVVDVFTTTTGIRVVEFRADGLFCNGEYYKLRGYGFRQGTYPALSNAVSNHFHYKDMRLAKQGGANFMREGHSATDPAVLDAMDRYGLFTVHATMCTETNYIERNTDDPARYFEYKKEFQRDICVRDRNHPSVLLWEFSNGPISAADATVLDSIVHEWDFVHPRPSIAAGNFCEACPGEVMDVMGTHQPMMWCKEQWPEKAIIALEYGWNFECSYRIDWAAMINSAVAHLWGPDRESGWVFDIEQNPEWVGWTLWTLSETPGEAPLHPTSLEEATGSSSNFGSLDANGRIPKVMYHAFEAAWSETPKVRIAGDWKDNAFELVVTAFASPHIETVELFAGGVSKGSRTVVNRIVTGSDRWRVFMPQPGTEIHAVGTDTAGTKVSSDTMVAYGPAAKIVLTADPEEITADGGDCASIIATVVDANGNWHRTDTSRIHFVCLGPVNYRGGFNHTRPGTTGNPMLNAECGKMAVNIRSTNTPGTITVQAKAVGLQTGSVELRSVAPDVTYDEVGVRPAVIRGARVPAAVILWARAVNGVVTVRYFMPQRGAATVELMDFQGRVLERSVLAHEHSAAATVRFGATEHRTASGLYVVRLTTPLSHTRALVFNVR